VDIDSEGECSSIHAGSSWVSLGQVEMLMYFCPHPIDFSFGFLSTAPGSHFEIASISLPSLPYGSHSKHFSQSFHQSFCWRNYKLKVLVSTMVTVLESSRELPLFTISSLLPKALTTFLKTKGSRICSSHNQLEMISTMVKATLFSNKNTIMVI